MYFRSWSILDIVVLVAQLCQTLCDPVDCSQPGSSVHGILQARIVEWVAISISTLMTSEQTYSVFRLPEVVTMQVYFVCAFWSLALLGTFSSCAVLSAYGVRSISQWPSLGQLFGVSCVSVKCVDILFAWRLEEGWLKKYPLVFTPLHDLTVMFIICIRYTFITPSS